MNYKNNKKLIIVGAIVIILVVGYFSWAIKKPEVHQTGDMAAIETLLAKQDWVNVIVMVQGDEFVSPVIDTLKAEDFQTKYQYSVIPGFAGMISASGMDKLLKDYRVTSITLDQKVTTELNY